MIATLRYWHDPDAIEHLAIEALEAALPADIKRTRPRRARFPAQAVAAMKRTNLPLLLVLDQFEEYFLYRTKHSQAEIEQPMAELLAARADHLRVLIALRDDSLHLLTKLRAIAPGILDTTVRLGYLNDAAAEQAIRGPIQQYNKMYRRNAPPIEVEDRLVDTLIHDLRQGANRPVSDDRLSSADPIELPYLQLAMTKLWAEEGGREATRLRAETLSRKLGGVQQIARQHVDGILSGLNPSEQLICVDIFRYLVTAGGGKMAYPTSDLAEQISDDRRDRRQAGEDGIVSEADLKAVLDKLARTET
jgi:hypothetical protein